MSISGRPRENLARRVVARESHHAATRMTARAAEEEPLERRAILRRAHHRADHEELIERQLRVMPVAATDAKLCLDVLWREQLCRAYRIAQPRCMRLERLQDRIQELLTLPFP